MISSAKRSRTNLLRPKKKENPGRSTKSINHLRTSSAKSSLYTMYFYNGKICGMRLEYVIMSKGGHCGY